MPDIYVTLGTLLAGLAPAVAIVVSAGRGAVLRRRAQLLRDAMPVEVDTTRRSVLELMHRATVAEMVGRQLTPAYRLLWPYAFWAVSAAVAAQVSDYSLIYFESVRRASYTGYSTAVFGDSSFTAPFLAVMGLLLSSYVAGSLSHAYDERRRVIKEFYDGETVQAPTRLLDVTTWQEDRGRYFDEGFLEELKSLLRSLAKFVLSLSPTLLSLGAGGFFGAVYHSFNEPRGVDLNRDGGFEGVLVLLAALSLVMTVLWVGGTTAERSKFRLPTVYDERPVSPEPEPEPIRERSRLRRWFS